MTVLESTSSIIQKLSFYLNEGHKFIEQNNAVFLGTDTEVGDKFVTIDTFIQTLRQGIDQCGPRRKPSH